MATLPTVARKFDGRDIRLIEAARVGEPSQIRPLLDEGVDPDDADANGLTAVIMASCAGKPDAVELLLDAGADLTRKDDSGYDAYHAAMFNGNFRGATKERYDHILRLLRSKTHP